LPCPPLGSRFTSTHGCLYPCVSFLEKRDRRAWAKKVKYDVRKSFADSRLRVKGRFVKKEDEELLRDLIQMI
jgi:hypothetical protein